MDSKRSFVAVVFLCMFLFSAINSTQGALLSYAIDTFGLEGAQQGYPASAQNIGCIAALALSLFLVPKVKKPRLLWISALVMGLCTLPLWRAGSAFPFIAVTLVMGLAMGLLDTLCSSSISDCFTGRTADRVMCAMHGTFGAAGILFPILYARIAAAGRWQNVYLVLFIAAAACMAAVIPISEKRASRVDRTEESGGKFRLRDVTDCLKGHGTALLLACMLLFTVYFGGVSVWCTRYIEQKFPGSALSGAVLPLVWAAVALGRILSAVFVRDKRTYLKVMPIVSGALLLCAVAAKGGVLTVALITLSVFATAAMIPFALSAAGQQYRRNTNVATTLTFFMVYFGQTAGSPILGAVAGARSVGTGLAVMGVCCILSALPLFLIKKE